MHTNDLSHILKPGGPGRLLEAEMVKANQVDDLPLLPGQWYIMHNMRMVSHVGTHIEAPYHINEDGADTAGIPLERLVGEAVVLDLRGTAPRAAVSLEQMKAAAEKAGGIRDGDLALLHTGWDRYYGQPEYKHEKPYISPEAMEWLVNLGLESFPLRVVALELED